jgi:glutamine synthetase
MDKDLYHLPPEELAKVPTVCGSLRQALESLKADHAFLLEGGVFTEDFLSGYIDLRMQEVEAFETMPHPIEYDMYYSA